MTTLIARVEANDKGNPVAQLDVDGRHLTFAHVYRGEDASGITIVQIDDPDTGKPQPLRVYVNGGLIYDNTKGRLRPC